MTVAYDQIVFIGYVIDTAPEIAPGGENYLGIKPPAKDIEARGQLILEAMRTARQALPSSSPPVANTLYVFVAPEFFFRGDEGGYEMDDVQLAVRELQTIAGDAAWEDWAFAFGTIVGKWGPATAGKTQICNFTLVQQGGVPAQGPSGARAIVKEFMSGIDFIGSQANTGGLLLGNVAHPEAAPRGPGGERQQKDYDGAGIFELAGINWAVEICLDHLSQRLQRSPALPGEKLVQVQLVPSCGASIDGRSVIAQAGGYILNVDGMRQNAHATLFQVGTPPVQLIADVVPVNVTEVSLPGSPPTTVAVSQLYANGAGAVYIYPPVPVPPELQVSGRTTRYLWKACDKPQWSFTFYLTTDDGGAFTGLLCGIDTTELNFDGVAYYLPVKLVLQFLSPDGTTPASQGTIDLNLCPGGSDYEYALYGDIRVPGFNFQGEIMRFSSQPNDPCKPVETIWSLAHPRG
jgi:hypothetical protein